LLITKGYHLVIRLPLRPWVASFDNLYYAQRSVRAFTVALAGGIVEQVLYMRAFHSKPYSLLPAIIYWTNSQLFYSTSSYLVATRGVSGLPMFGECNSG
jgi:hypothetical protein